jgi:hypothetical protein
MTRAHTYPGPRFEVPDERPAAVRGLSQRLDEKGRERFWVRGRLVSLPVHTCGKWAEDKLKEGSRAN